MGALALILAAFSCLRTAVCQPVHQTDTIITQPSAGEACLCEDASNGFIEEFLDSTFTSTCSPHDAVYRRYIYCLHGRLFFPVPLTPGLFEPLRVNYRAVLGEATSSPALLDDTVFHRNRKGQLRCIEVYRSGYPITSTVYRRDGSTIKSFTDYTRHCPAKPASFYVELISHDGFISKGYFQDNKKGTIGLFHDCK